ncbi:MAG: hypothetical protein ACK5TH_09555 [Prosthecobacter sp.]
MTFPRLFISLLCCNPLLSLAQQTPAPDENPLLSTSELFPTAEEEAAMLPPGTAASGGAAAPVGPVDPDLPQPFDFNALTGVVQNSPFTRIVNVSDSLVLTGVAYVDGKPVVTIFDKDKKESLVVTDQPNLRGWTLVEASRASDMTRASAKVSIGGEPVSIRYDAAALTPDAMKKDKKEGKDGRDGGPPPGGDKFNRGGRGPSEEDRKKYESLSDGAKEKFRNGMREMFSNEKFRNASEEDRRNAIRSMFDKIEKEDKKR